MKKHKHLWLATALLLALFTSCEKANIGNDSIDEETSNNNVFIRIAGFEQIPFDNYRIATKAQQDITKLCSRINFSLFNGDTKVSAINQKEGDNDFGTVSLHLDAGTYKLVVIAHNGTGAATISSPQKITFPNNKLSDTFYYCSDITVDAKGNTFDLQLKRAVAMFRLVTNEALPSEVKKIKFYYTGGSSTFDATTGYGCVNSKQTEILNVSNGQKQFEVYTFPHDESDELKITVTALDANETALHERIFENVPVQRNMITQYTGSFYESTENFANSFKMTADGDWTKTNSYEY